MSPLDLLTKSHRVSTAPARTEPAPGAPVEIAHDVWCLGPKGRTQTNVYLVAAGSSWTLVHAGWAADGPAIRQAAAGLFGVGRSPASILVTHEGGEEALRQLSRASES